MENRLRTNRLDTQIGARLRQLRKDRRCSLAEFALLLGVPASLLAQYECGLAHIEACRLFSIANMCDTRLSYFFYDTPNRQSAPSPLGRRRRELSPSGAMAGVSDPASMLDVIRGDAKTAETGEKRVARSL